ncbi:MAG: hypothetical protein IT581_02540 [Verrucomicrobiales bacterium]|nr:hypothetical protein [Verrucomicrobiales bacterium]
MKITLPFWRTVLVSGSIAAAFSAGYCLRPPTHSQQVPSTTACAPIETAVPAKPVPSAMKDAASWSQLESDDYRAFVTNLRRFGCPNSTVADIVLSDLLAAGHLDIESRNQFWSQLASSLPDRAHAERAIRAANQLLPDMHLALSSPSKNVPTIPAYEVEVAAAAPTEFDQSVVQDLFKSMLQQPNGPANPAEFRLMRIYRGIQLTSQEASALSQLEPSDNTAETLRSSHSESANDGDAPRKDAIRQLLGEDRYQEYERMQDRNYTKLQDVMEDLRIDASQIVATYESLKGTQALGDPAATAAELSQRFGADAAESWVEAVNPSRPGYEGEISAITSAISSETQTADAPRPIETTAPVSPAQP